MAWIQWQAGMAQRRHQRHAPHRHRAGAAHHLHGDGAVDAEGADRERAQEGQSDAPPRSDRGSIVVEYTAIESCP